MVKIMPLDGQVVSVEARGLTYTVQDKKVFQISLYDLSPLKSAEEALRQSEINYRTLFETIPQGVVFQDSEGKIISANPAALKILDLSFEHIEGRTSSDPIWQAIHEDGSEFPGEDHPISVARKTGQPVMGVITGMRHLQTGEVRWLKVDAIPQFLPGADRPYQVYASFTDITDLVDAMAAQKELLDHKEKTAARDEAILNSLISGVIITDLQGCLESVNPSVLKLLGFTDINDAMQYQYQGGKLFDLLTPSGDTVPPKDTPLARILSGEILSDVELQIKNHRSGEYRYALLGGRLAYNTDGYPFLGMLTLRDIHALHLAQVEHDKLMIELARRGAELDAIFTAIPDGILIVTAQPCEKSRRI